MLYYKKNMPTVTFFSATVRAVASWYLSPIQWFQALCNPTIPAVIVNNGTGPTPPALSSAIGCTSSGTCPPVLGALSSTGGKQAAAADVTLPSGHASFVDVFAKLRLKYQGPAAKIGKSVAASRYATYEDEGFVAYETDGTTVLYSIEAPALFTKSVCATAATNNIQPVDAKHLIHSSYNLLGGATAVACDAAWGGERPKYGKKSGASEAWPANITNEIISSWVTKTGVQCQIKVSTDPKTNLSTKLRDLIETDGLTKGNSMKPDNQCWKSLKGKLESLEPCYICGLPMLNFADKAVFEGAAEFKTGYACEHVIPVFLMCLICGLNGVVHENMYQAILMLIPHDGAFPNDFVEWREEVRALGYQWSHASCNEVKNQYPFIAFEFSTAPPAPQITRADPIFENVLYNLYRLLRVEQKREQCWRKFYHPWLALMVGGTPVPAIDDLTNWANWQAAQVVEENLKPLVAAIGTAGRDGAPGEFFSMSICCTVRLMILKSHAVQAVAGFNHNGEIAENNLSDLYEAARNYLTKGAATKLAGQGGGSRVGHASRRSPRETTGPYSVKPGRTRAAELNPVVPAAGIPTYSAFEDFVSTYLKGYQRIDLIMRGRNIDHKIMCQLIRTHEIYTALALAPENKADNFNAMYTRHLNSAYEVLIKYDFKEWGSIDQGTFGTFVGVTAEAARKYGDDPYSRLSELEAQFFSAAGPGGKKVYLGYFATEEAAKASYNARCLELGLDPRWVDKRQGSEFHGVTEDKSNGGWHAKIEVDPNSELDEELYEWIKIAAGHDREREGSDGAAAASLFGRAAAAAAARQQQQQQSVFVSGAAAQDESADAEAAEMVGDVEGGEEYESMATGGGGQCQPCSTNKVYKPPKSSRKKSIKKKKSKKKTKKKYIKKSPKYSTKKSLKKKSFKKGSRKKTLRKKSKRKSKK